MSDVTSQKYYDDLYGQIKSIIVTKSITSTLVIVLASKAMTIASSFKDLSGIDKKNLVINAVTAVVHDLLEDTETVKVSDELRTALLAGVDMLPVLIDQTIAVSKAISDKNVAEGGKGCFCF